MAKPIAGNVFYNSTTDRPRVALRAGEFDLLTTADAGGGAVSDVTGTGAIDASPTTGNVVVSLDESALENGGAQEISIAGLSGQAADPQLIEVAKAGVLVGTRDQINLTDGGGVTFTVTDNGGNNRVDITAAVDAADPWKFYHKAPASAHADDDEFTTSTLNARWTVIKDTARTTPATATGPVVGAAGPGGTAFNKSNDYRGTFLAWQGEPGGVIRTISSLPAVTQFRFRCAGACSPTNGSEVLLLVGESIAGVPDITNNYAAMGWASAVVNETHYVAYGRQAGGGGFQVNGPSLQIPFTDMEFILVISCVGLNTTAYWYIRTGPSSPTLINSHNVGSTSNFGQSRAAYVYMRFNTFGPLYGGVTRDAIGICDYIRVRNDWDLEAY